LEQFETATDARADYRFHSMNEFESRIAASRPGEPIVRNQGSALAKEAIA
jgi:hypothetical protein